MVTNNGITQELINEILANVQLMLGETTKYTADILTLYIKSICNNILIKTNRNIFPEELKYVVVDMVKNKFDCNNLNSDDLKQIQSMSEQGRSVNFGTSEVVQYKLNLIARKQLNEYDQLINRYKLLYKVTKK